MSKMLSGPQIWEKIFAPSLHKQFLEELDSASKIEAIIKSEGGQIVVDHGATRTVEPRLHDFITRLVGAFGLIPFGHYDFPKKKLTAIDLQLKDRDSFKWFSTLIQMEKFSQQLQEAVQEDVQTRAKNAMSDAGLAYLEKLEKDKVMEDGEAELFVEEILFRFLKRQGKPVKESTLELAANESSELVNALLLGPGFNHIAYTLNALAIKDWYGLEIIEALTARLESEGFAMLPEIQGVAGGSLRQTSTKADHMLFEVEKKDGTIGQIHSPAKFIELIQRGAEKDTSGKMKLEGKKIKIFRGFLSANTEKIYEATELKGKDK